VNARTILPRGTVPQVEWVPGALSLGGKRPEHEADHSCQYNAEVKNAWNYTSTPPYVFMARCLIKQRDNFTCSIANISSFLPVFSFSLFTLALYLFIYLYTCLLSFSLFLTLPFLNLAYGLDDRGSRVRFPAGAGNFSFHYRVQNGSGAHPASYPMGTRGSFPADKVASG
jgi:hypothetical protein